MKKLERIRPNKLWKPALVFLLLLGGVWAGVHWGMPAYYQCKYQREFAPQPYLTQYQDGMPIHEIDFSVFRYRLNDIVALININADPAVKLPRDIRYYTWENGERKLALTLEKGTRVQWTFDSGWVACGCGNKSYPTYEKEWRYARAYLPLGHTKEYMEATPHYYVRLEDLEAVTRSIFDQTKALRSGRYSRSEAVYYITREIDVQFYEYGIYCSPNLTKASVRPSDT